VDYLNEIFFSNLKFSKVTPFFLLSLMKHAIQILFTVFLCCSLSFSKAQKKELHKNTISFWKEMEQLCGKAFTGEVVAAPANDTLFKNKILLMHVRKCDENKIRIPFVVGGDRSRTWVFTLSEDNIELKHDHRHRDGSEDSITQYGGRTVNSGSATLQVFPADPFTTAILPAAFANVWWVELVPGKYFTYNLRRMNTDRWFSIRFDLSKPVEAPEAPWGWKD
jgi:hypothetical protein